LDARNYIPNSLRVLQAVNTRIDYTILTETSLEIAKYTQATHIDLSEVPGEIYTIIIRIDAIYDINNESLKSGGLILSGHPEAGVYGYIWKITKKTETRHRDKYIKVKVRYTGEDLAVI
jgi:hypothetical protein